MAIKKVDLSQVYAKPTSGYVVRTPSECNDDQFHIIKETRLPAYAVVHALIKYALKHVRLGKGECWDLAFDDGIEGED